MYYNVLYADVRLEWDFTQTYYDEHGAELSTESGTTGVYIVHIWRDVSVWEWQASGRLSAGKQCEPVKRAVLRRRPFFLKQ